MSKRYKGTSTPQKIAAAMLALLFIGVGAFAGMKLVFKEPELPADTAPETNDETNQVQQPVGPVRKDGFYNILVCGVDDGNGGSDTMILASIDSSKPAVNCISIPRDTLIDVDWKVKTLRFIPLATHGCSQCRLFAFEIS